MGYGEVVGNESVHWAIVQEDELGRETASIRGRDPIRFQSIGTKKGRKREAAKGAPGRSLFSKPNFAVRLMYPSKEEAQRARDSAVIVERDGAVFLVLKVPAVRRKKANVEPPRPPAEVRVDW